MKIVGIVLLILGLIGTIVYGYQALQDSDSFKILGLNVAVSSANWTPVIISGVVLIVGLVIVSMKK